MGYLSGNGSFGKRNGLRYDKWIPLEVERVKMILPDFFSEWRSFKYRSTQPDGASRNSIVAIAQQTGSLSTYFCTTNSRRHVGQPSG